MSVLNNILIKNKPLDRYAERLQNGADTIINSNPIHPLPTVQPQPNNNVVGSNELPEIEVTAQVPNGTLTNAQAPNGTLTNAQVPNGTLTNAQVPAPIKQNVSVNPNTLTNSQNVGVKNDTSEGGSPSGYNRMSVSGAGATVSGYNKMSNSPVVNNANVGNVQPIEVAAQPTAANAGAETTDGLPPKVEETVQEQPANTYGYSPEQYEYLMKNGVTPEMIALSRNYNPSGGGYFEQMYRATHNTPTLNENQLRSGRNIAALGDALGLLAQGLGSSRGALIRERGQNETAQYQAGQREQQIRNLYEQQRNRYDSGLWGAINQDYADGLNRQRQAQNNINNVLNRQLSEQRMVQNARQAEAELQQKQEYNNSILALKYATLQQKAIADANNDKRQSALLSARLKQINSQIAANNALTAKRYSDIANTTIGGGTKGTTFYVDAQEGQEGAIANGAGGYMRPVQIPKGSEKHYLTQAKNDPEFLASIGTDPELFKIMGWEAIGRVSDSELLQKYINYLSRKESGMSNIDPSRAVGYQYNSQTGKGEYVMSIPPAGQTNVSPVTNSNSGVPTLGQTSGSGYLDALKATTGLSDDDIMMVMMQDGSYESDNPSLEEYSKHIIGQMQEQNKKGAK